MSEQVESGSLERLADSDISAESESPEVIPVDLSDRLILEVTPPEERSIGRGRFSLAAMTFGLLALLTFPLAFGLPALICATVAHLRHESWRWPGSALAVSGALIGLAILIVTKQL